VVGGDSEAVLFSVSENRKALVFRIVVSMFSLAIVSIANILCSDGCATVGIIHAAQEHDWS